MSPSSIITLWIKICTDHYRITSFLKFIILLGPCHETSYSLEEILRDNYMHRRNFTRYFTVSIDFSFFLNRYYFLAMKMKNF